METDKIFDKTHISARPKVRIIDGFGTGALANFIRHFFKPRQHIDKFVFPPQNQGEHNATIVELKN